VTFYRRLAPILWRCFRTKRQAGGFLRITTRKHAIDCESPPPPPRVCMGIHSHSRKVTLRSRWSCYLKRPWRAAARCLRHGRRRKAEALWHARHEVESARVMNLLLDLQGFYLKLGQVLASKVGQRRSTLSKPVMTAPMVSALEGKVC